VSRDIYIYARKKETVSIDDILAEMQARGVPVVWRSGSAKKTGSTQWRTGDFRVGGAVIEAETRPWTQAIVKRALTDYRSVLSDANRDALSATRRGYTLSGSWSSAEDGSDRVLIHMADVIARLGEGIVVDTLNNRFYNLDELRARFPYLAGTANG
jgi:hypothetical protein